MSLSCGHAGMDRKKEEYRDKSFLSHTLHIHGNVCTQIIVIFNMQLKIQNLAIFYIFVMIFFSSDSLLFKEWFVFSAAL